MDEPMVKEYYDDRLVKLNVPSDATYHRVYHIDKDGGAYVIAEYVTFPAGQSNPRCWCRFRGRGHCY